MTELITLEELKQLAARLKLHGLLAHRDELNEKELPRIQAWLHREETERKKRGLVQDNTLDEGQTDLPFNDPVEF